MKFYSMFCASLDGRGACGRMGTCICMAEVLHCSPEITTTLFISCTPIQNKTFKVWGKEEKRLGCYISVCPLLLRKMSRLPKALLLVPLTGPPTSHRGSSSLHWTPGLGYPGCGLNPSLPRQDLCPDSLHFLLSPLPGAQVLT